MCECVRAYAYFGFPLILLHTSINLALIPIQSYASLGLFSLSASASHRHSLIQSRVRWGNKHDNIPTQRVRRARVSRWLPSYMCDDEEIGASVDAQRWTSSGWARLIARIRAQWSAACDDDDDDDDDNRDAASETVARMKSETCSGSPTHPEKANEWMNEWMDGWRCMVYEWMMDEWMNACMYSTCTSTHITFPSLTIIMLLFFSSHYTATCTCTQLPQSTHTTTCTYLHVSDARWMMTTICD